MWKARKRLRNIAAIAMGVIAMAALTGCDANLLVFDSKGPVAAEIESLIWISILLCAVIVIPVIGLFAFIVWRYRDKPGNKAPYKPDWSHSTTLETIWWGIPIVIIILLGFFTVRTTYALVEPPKDTKAEPITIQVTSLDWKWLFQYPDLGIATVNYLHIPEDVPIQFVMTSDAAMNSFWVPQLAGQMYTMPGMAMRMWVQADEPGVFSGKGANFSGEYFERMQFNVVSQTESEFNNWVAESKKSTQTLDQAAYAKLSEKNTMGEQTFGSMDQNLFAQIVLKNGGHHHPNNGLDIRGQFPLHGTDSDGADHSGGSADGNHDMSNMNHDMSDKDMHK
ncbi:ubiquinol oxidase subunit II [Paenibacillus beijingensis]|nr:ubiquinol oxidase subunit II [Paenibacillus beijingensis]